LKPGAFQLRVHMCQGESTCTAPPRSRAGGPCASLCARSPGAAWRGRSFCLLPFSSFPLLFFSSSSSYTTNVCVAGWAGEDVSLVVSCRLPSSSTTAVPCFCRKTEARVSHHHHRSIHFRIEGTPDDWIFWGGAWFTRIFPSCSLCLSLWLVFVSLSRKTRNASLSHRVACEWASRRTENL
jgi:hypothetical protein